MAGPPQKEFFTEKSAPDGTVAVNARCLVRRFQRRFEAGGLPALARAAGYPAGRPRLPRSRERLVSRLKAEGLSNREIGRRIGVSEVAIRKLLSRLGWRAAC